MKTKEELEKEYDEKGCGFVYTVEEFARCIKLGFYNIYDGNGYFHDGEKRTDYNVWDNTLPKGFASNFPYVIWYNA